MKQAQKKVLVTGSNGYIGSVLTDLLIKNGYDVFGLDTFYFKDVNLGQHLQKYPSRQLDIRNQKYLQLNTYDAIIHLAALSNDPLGALNDQLTKEINYSSSVSLAAKAKKAGVKRFIFSSSCSIYGIAANGVVDENSEVNPLTAYAKSKIDTEKELVKLADDNFFVGIMRNSTVYGYSPKFRDDLVINNLTACAVATNQIRIMSDGTPWRPLIDVRDLSRVFIEILKTDNKKINGKVINIGFKKSNYRVKDLVRMIKRQLPECEIIFTGEHGADTRSYRVDFSLFESLFPHVRQLWPPEKSIKDMINKMRINKYSAIDFQNKRFTRLSTLKNLIANGKLDNNLFWT